MYPHQPFTPLDGRLFPRFSGVRTFFRLPLLQDEKELEQADVAILGVPFDGGTSFRPGARFAPEAIRSMSTLGRGYNPTKDIHIFQKLKVIDVGDCPVTPQDIEKTHGQIAETVARLLHYNCFPMIVGGDHSTTIGSLKAIYEKYGPLGIVHLDAHTDTYPPAWGCDVHHGTFMRVAFERGYLRKDGVVQIGIRGPFAGKQDIITPTQMGYHVVMADDIHQKGTAFIQEIFTRLSQGPVFVSVDVDCLDPAFAPGTGTPVPGGLASWQLLHVLQALSGLQMVGADVVEVSPPYDVAGITSLVAVSVIQEILASLARTK